MGVTPKDRKTGHSVGSVCQSIRQTCSLESVLQHLIKAGDPLYCC